MAKEIGNFAGKVWTALHSNDGMMTYNQLKRGTLLKDFELWAAVGWLARENKVEVLNDVIALKE